METLGLSGASVLVTGAYGLLGSWLVKTLVEADAHVSVVRRDVTARSGLQAMGLEDSIDVVHGDICTTGLIERALNEYEVDTVLHLAAQTIVPIANRSPLPTFMTNILGTWTVLEACRRHGVRRVIVASSDKAYGPRSELPYREDHALTPLFPYDVSKATADMLARCYWHTWQLPVAVTRFANLYGGGDMNRSRLVPEVIAAALAGRPPIIRSDGSPERDFLYVEDAVAAYLAILDALGRGVGCGEAFNAGGSRPRRVLDIVTTICRLAGTDVAPEIRGYGSSGGEIDRQWVDFSKLHAVTGWEPRVSLEEGLQRTIDWYRRHGWGSRATGVLV